MNNLLFCLMTMAALPLNGYVGAASVEILHHAPQPVGKIEDQMIFVPNNDCGPMSLHFDVTPFFDGYGEPLTYCLSNVFIDGDVSHFTLTLNPFTGMLDIPIGWFGVNTTINLRIVVKNGYGSAFQNMRVLLEPCGG